MTTGERCPRCGAEVTADAPLGLCPACLLKAGLQAPTDGLPPTDGPTMDTGSRAGEAPTFEAAAVTPDGTRLLTAGRDGVFE